MTHDELTALLPAYVVGALEPDERRAVEQALAADPAARALLADYQASAAALVALAPLRTAPEHLHADLQARLDARRPTRQPDAARLRRAPWRRLPRPAWVAAALVVVIAGGVLAALLLRRDDSAPPAADGARALYSEIAALDHALRYAVVARDLKPDVSGELVASPDGRRAVIRVEGLPVLTEENVFQLWLVDDAGVRTSGGLFRQTDGDATYIEVPLAAPFDAYQRFGVSLEPAGGSPFPDRPTGPGVFSVALEV